MQQSSLEFFCEECGAANPEGTTLCIACNEPLTHSQDSLPAPVKPVVVAPPSNLQVTAGAALAPVMPGDAIAASAPLKPGMLVQNRYRIECEIGQGGYSVVYKATDTAHRNRPVTIKQVNLNNLTPRQVIEATETFNRETTLLPVLKHESIPRFYGHFTDPEHWYLVMEYVPGQTLEEYLQKSSSGGYCSLEETLRMGVSLSAILEYLHFCKPPLIFRDVKPANIMLTPHKKLYLIDFGIARAFHPGKTKDTTPLGSPGFAAPEQYGRSQSDARTDIYGLGVTLQTLLTGRDPLELRAGEPSRRPGPVSPRLQQLLDSMMDPDPTRRPRNMTIVRQSLQRLLAQTQRAAHYYLGLIVGFTYWLLFYTMVGLVTPYGSFFSPFYALAFCLGGLVTLVGIFTLPVFLFIPAKRYITFGVMTITLIVFLLVQGHILPFL